MSVRNLEFLFRPRSVAVIGASERPHSVGRTVMRNVLDAGFEGPVIPVNPRYRTVAGIPASAGVPDMPVTPDLAVICTPPATVPGIVRDLGARGTRAAVVLTAGLSALEDDRGRPLDQAMLDEARPHTLRILGPNCVGLLVPGCKLNASFSHAAALPGRIAFVSQSGALCTAVLDWARSRGIGFSQFISLGNSADVDFGDVLDYLANDNATGAILLYIEAVTQARKFMSAARAAARNKPVLAVKAGRVAEGIRAAASHTGALAGADAVYDAALRRAGIVRVLDIEELFDAVETLARAKPLRGDRLAIVTNGGGPGVLATDILIMGGGRLAELSEDTLCALDRVLPPTWSRGNPVDIIGDAPPRRYADALDVVLAAPEVDALLFIHAPTAIVDSASVARDLAARLRDARLPVFASWLGGDAVAEARRTFGQAGIPDYDTPEKAARAFLHLVDYKRNQDMLMETPPEVPEVFAPDIEAARAVVSGAMSDGRAVLTEPEAKAVLAAYGVPVVETRIARSAGEAAAQAAEMGFPVAVKILSPDVTHKSDVGGVALDLETVGDVESAAATMTRRMAALRPEARLQGFTVQRMARRPGAHEAIVGATTDPTFGPTILFGQGGTAVEVIADSAVALPPLNMNLARELISRTRLSRLLAGYRERPAADMNALCLALLQISQLVSDIDVVAELDVNPLLVDENGVLALDARIRVAPPPLGGAGRLSIRPYPKQLEEHVALDGMNLLVRPIRPEDEPYHRAFFHALAPEDIYFRFFNHVRELSHSWAARLTQIDYDREMAFVAVRAERGTAPEILGVVRAMGDPDNIGAEFAIVVRSDIKGRGLGRVLLNKIVAYCRARGTRRIVGHVLAENRRMLALAQQVGFTARYVPDQGSVEISLDLAPVPAAG